MFPCVRDRGEREIRLTATSSSRRVLALEFVRRYFRDFGQSPSLREIGASLATSPQHVRAILLELERGGLITLRKGKARGIALTDRGGDLSDSEVLAMLSRRGWTVNMSPPATNPALPPAAPLRQSGNAKEAVHGPETPANEDPYARAR